MKSLRSSWNSDKMAAADLAKKSARGRKTGRSPKLPAPVSRATQGPSLEETYGTARVAEYHRRQNEINQVARLYRETVGGNALNMAYICHCHEANWRWLRSDLGLNDPAPAIEGQDRQYTVNELVALLRDPARVADLKRGRFSVRSLKEAFDREVSVNQVA